MYKKIDLKISFKKLEKDILDFWQDNDIFYKSIKQRTNKKGYSFYDGPPFATGLPHFGHFVPNTLKDVIPRYKTMKGFKVNRVFGWDCHGLPVEKEVEKKRNTPLLESLSKEEANNKLIDIFKKSKILNGKEIADFNNECIDIVMQCANSWEDYISRLGRWVNYKDNYKTMDLNYMESVWWAFSQFFQKGYVYKGFKILPYSSGLKTPVSASELRDTYKTVTDPAIVVKFKIIKDNQDKDLENTYFLVWTTTPWTLTCNVLLAAHKDICYIKIKDKKTEQNYILSKNTLSLYYKDQESYEIIEEFKGIKLKDYTYEPLFSYFNHLKKQGAFKMVNDDYVIDYDHEKEKEKNKKDNKDEDKYSKEPGTSIVHIAPAFGEDDFRIFKRELNNIEVFCPLDDSCLFTDEITDYKGLFIKDADKDIINKLKENDRLFKKDQILHKYPFCPRSDTIIVYRTLNAWFLDINKIKVRLLELNQEINWMPESLKNGRMKKILEDAPDWTISRNRYWGNPIPIWEADDNSNYYECLGSISELEQKSGIKITDLHRHNIDDISYDSVDLAGNKKHMVKIKEVMDCWFESGSMPFAQYHYPFENKEEFENNFPADFIAEGIDQTRGWFYSLIVISAVLFDKIPFKNVIVNGIVLDKDGKKMSKSKGNYTNPLEIMDLYSADSLRIFLMSSSIIEGEDIKYYDDSAKYALKNIVIPLRNSYSFFSTYANIDKINIDKEIKQENISNFIDKWIISELELFIKRMDNNLASYNLKDCNELIINFLDLLNNWYIRRSRRRFWSSEFNQDKLDAYHTLFTVLLKISKLLAPFMPFVSEELYLSLKNESMQESVHLCNYPYYDEENRELEIENKMSISQNVIKLARQLRKIHNIKVRQPLNSIHIITRITKEREILKEMEELIKEEINVKEVIYRENEEGLVTYTAKAKFTVLGKVLGKKMKEASQKIGQLSNAEIKSIVEGNYLIIDLDGEEFTLDQSNIEIIRTKRENLEILNENTLTIALDAVITDELKQEGLTRDLIRSIQNLRKDMAFELDDRIILSIKADDILKNALKNNLDYFKNETLTIEINFKDTLINVNIINVDNKDCEVIIEKA